MVSLKMLNLVLFKYKKQGFWVLIANLMLLGHQIAHYGSAAATATVYGSINLPVVLFLYLVLWGEAT
jgi:hypothetical protein